jgi:Transport and Golgi organisation 2
VCTLIVGLGVVGPGTLVLGANRDEAPERPTAGPGVLVEHPRVVGGRDLVAGGTWLAVREGRFVSALMNRRPLPGDPDDPSMLRSRGLLCLEAAASGPPFGHPSRIDPGTGESRPERLDAALRLFQAAPYARCTLVGVDPAEGGWAIHSVTGSTPDVRVMPEGWNVITHQELNDRGEPRTRALLDRLDGTRPRSVDDALQLLAKLLSDHGDGGAPAVCIHRERFPTVSSSLLATGAVDRPRYLHAPGPPCATEYADLSSLLQADAAARGPSSGSAGRGSSRERTA